MERGHYHGGYRSGFEIGGPRIDVGYGGYAPGYGYGYGTYAVFPWSIILTIIIIVIIVAIVGGIISSATSGVSGSGCTTTTPQNP
jgi:hypothetical protein